ncbi:MAG: ABC transporter permease [Eubacterium sp.]|nr:ABC transporter permease [Eubacterium sp.]
MQVFNLFFKIAKSKLPSGLIYMIVFFAVCFPMSKISAEKTSFEETRISVVVFDEDKTPESQRLIEDIGKKHKIKELKNDQELILDAMYYGQVDYTLSIKKGYAENLKKTDETDTKDALFETFHLHDSYATAMMEQYLDEYVRTVRSYVAGGNELSAAIDKTEKQIGVEAEVDLVDFDEKTVVDENYTQSYAFVFRYMPYIFIAVFINVLCPILIVMKKKDQRFRMNCSSTKMSSFSAQIFGASAVLGGAIWLFVMIGSMIMYGGVFQGTNCWIAVANSVIFAMISAAIAIIVSTFCPSENVVNMITQSVGLGMCFLCGVFVPQSLLGDGVLAAARFLPAYWYEKANDILCGAQSGDLGDVGVCMLIEGGFLVALVLVTMLLSRQRPQGHARKSKAVTE